MKAVWAIASVMIKELIRKKDFYVLLIFLVCLLGFLASQTFFQLDGVTRYIRDFGYSFMMFFSFVIAVTFTARQLPAEIESKTIYPLLAKPLTRFRIILGKYAGGFLVSAAAFTLFYIVYFLFYLYGGVNIETALLVQVYIFGVLFLAMACAIVLFFSNLLTTAANVTISFILYFAINGLSDTIREGVIYSKGINAVISGIFYYIMPHLEFFDMRVRVTHSWDPVPWWVVVSVGVYTILYTFVLLQLSGILFKRKRF